MANHQPDLAGSILERISRDRAVQEAFECLLTETSGLRAEILELTRAMAHPLRQRYLTTAEVAKMFGVSETTVRWQTINQTWPAWRDGWKMRFGPEEVSAIEEGEAQTAASSLDAVRAPATQ